MDFLQALQEAIDFIECNQEGAIDEVYLYEPISEAKIYLKCEGGLRSIDRDEPLLEQLYVVLAHHEKDGGIRVNDLLCEWEVCVWKQCFTRITSGRI